MRAATASACGAFDSGRLSKLLKSAVAMTIYFAQTDWSYDAGMTTAKIAISLPKHQLARVHREVRAGRADSVSGYIAGVLAEQEKRDSLRTLLRDLIEQHGQPAPDDVKWSERMLPRLTRG